MSSSSSSSSASASSSSSSIPPGSRVNTNPATRTYFPVHHPTNPHGTIACLEWSQQTELWKYIEDDIPVVINNCPLITAVATTWSPAYLAEVIVPEFPNTVYASDTLSFQYWNSKTDVYEFNEPTDKLDLSMKQFLHAIRTGFVPRNNSPTMSPPGAPNTTASAEGGGSVAPPVPPAGAGSASGTPRTPQTPSSLRESNSLDAGDRDGYGGGEDEESLGAAEYQRPQTRKYYYLQQSLVAEMGTRMMEEFQKFSLETAVLFKKAGQWDNLSNNLLLVGPRGAVTPCHFDEQQNLFAQLYGVKRVRLFPPAAWARLYPFPTWHPCDRQCQLNLPSVPGAPRLDTEGDNNRFPAFAAFASNPEYAEQYVDLQPGQLLYVPQYWFHQMEALEENTSLSWWFVCTSRKKHGDVAHLKIQPTDPLKVAFRRNLEKLFVTMMNNDLASTHNLFCAIASGRINLPKSLLVAPLDGRSAPTMQEQIEPPPVIGPDILDNSSSSSALTIPTAWEEVLGRISHTIAAVLPTGSVAITLRELTAGRFNGLRIA